MSKKSNNLEVTKKSKQELTTVLMEKRNALRDLRFGISGSKNRNVKAGAALKKDIARILTELTSRRNAV